MYHRFGQKISGQDPKHKRPWMPMKLANMVPIFGSKKMFFEKNIKEVV